MPGVNVPWSQVLYYLVTLTISGVFHEFGHAISAVRYDCTLHNEQREIYMGNFVGANSCPLHGIT